VAYQVCGSGPVDLIFSWGLMSHLDLMWTNPDVTYLYEQFASFSRLILFDKIGTGLSDPITVVPTLEDRLDDISAVASATGAERFALFGESEAGPTAVLYASLHPDRVSALVIFGSIARGPTAELARADADPAGAAAWAKLEDLLNDWGHGLSIDVFAPSISGVGAMRRAFALLERSAVSPSMAQALIGLYRTIDITDVLPRVAVPTLIMHRRGDFVPVSQGRFLGANIPGARYVEMDGNDHLLCVGDVDSIIAETRQFLTGQADHHVGAQRTLATVLFTDIVDSTAQASQLGDAAWRRQLEQSAAVTRDVVMRHGGRVVKSTGDGALAVFPSPARAIHCAIAVSADLAALGVPIRCGLHTGECEVIGDDVGGVAVHVGSRIAHLAGPGEVLTSSTMKDLVMGSGIHFVDRGQHMLKGLPEAWQVYAVAGAEPARAVDAPIGYMTTGDRVAVRAARAAPRTVRALGQLASRRPRR
jgi:class 3 adenylate cyclase